MSLTECKDILRNAMIEEIALLNTFCMEEEKMKEFLVEKDWPGLNNVIANTNPLIKQINLTEEIRNDAYLKLMELYGYSKDSSFYHLIVNFPGEERDVFSVLYRNLKLAVLKIHGITGGIESYVSNASDSMKQILNELFPVRKGKMYSKAGSPKDLENNPMVLNHQL